MIWEDDDVGDERYRGDGHGAKRGASEAKDVWRCEMDGPNDVIHHHQPCRVAQQRPGKLSMQITGHDETIIGIYEMMGYLGSTQWTMRVT